MDAAIHVRLDQGKNFHCLEDQAFAEVSYFGRRGHHDLVGFELQGGHFHTWFLPGKSVGVVRLDPSYPIISDALGVIRFISGSLDVGSKLSGAPSE